MVTCSKVKQKPKDGCVCALRFSAEKALKVCDHTKMDKVEEIFDLLSALMRMETQDTIFTHLNMIRQS